MRIFFFLLCPFVACERSWTTAERSRSHAFDTRKQEAPRKVSSGFMVYQHFTWPCSSGLLYEGSVHFELFFQMLGI